MNRKYFLLFIPVFIIMILFIYAVSFQDKKEETVILLGTEEEYGDMDNVSYWAEQTGSEIDCDNEDDIPYRILIENPQVFADFNLPPNAQRLSFYLERYLAYYTELDSSKKWHVSIAEGSLVNDVNFPYFCVIVEEYPEEPIKCIYSTCEESYNFICPYIENMKK